MSKKTDYKKLWRKSQEDNKRLAWFLGQANDRVKVLQDLINKIKNKEITFEEIQSYAKNS